MDTFFGSLTIIAFAAIAIISFVRDYYHKKFARKIFMEVSVALLKSGLHEQDKSPMDRAAASSKCDETSFGYGDMAKPIQPTPEPSKTIFRETHENSRQTEAERIFICRKVKYGTNNNFVRFVPIDPPTSRELHLLALKYDTIKRELSK